MPVHLRDTAYNFLWTAGHRVFGFAEKSIIDIKQIKNFSTNSRDQNTVSIGKLLGLIVIVTAGYSLTRRAITWYYSESKTNNKPKAKRPEGTEPKPRPRATNGKPGDKKPEGTEPKPGPRVTNGKPGGIGPKVKDRKGDEKGPEARNPLPNDGNPTRLSDDDGKKGGAGTELLNFSDDDDFISLNPFSDDFGKETGNSTSTKAEKKEKTLQEANYDAAEDERVKKTADLTEANTAALAAADEAAKAKAALENALKLVQTRKEEAEQANKAAETAKEAAKNASEADKNTKETAVKEAAEKANAADKALEQANNRFETAKQIAQEASDKAEAARKVAEEATKAAKAADEVANKAAEKLGAINGETDEQLAAVSESSNPPQISVERPDPPKEAEKTQTAVMEVLDANTPPSSPSPRSTQSSMQQNSADEPRKPRNRFNLDSGSISAVSVASNTTTPTKTEDEKSKDPTDAN